jgi:ATP-dependent 26S proteasome regulatory subunit
VPGSDETLTALRAALKASPDNVPLRLHLAETLLGYSNFEDAEREFKDALRLSPQNRGLKLGLARAYMQTNRLSAAIVVLEELVNGTGADRPAPVERVWLARALLKSGEPGRAAHQYRLAVDADASVADPDLARQLAMPTAAPDRTQTQDLRSRPSEQTDPALSTPTVIERPTHKFDHVGGMERVKDEIRMKIIMPSRHPELYKAYGKSAGGGILMYGPPGCGKTHLARATAGEVGAGFICVGIADVLNMYIGESERNLRDLFEQARTNKPCVMFFDEVDALGASRTDMRQSAGRHLVNQFLNEMDGVQSSNEGVLILAATNAPWHMDPAFRRPGRFDRIIFVPPPDDEARAAIVRIQLAGKPSVDVDFDAVAAKTEGFSGADLKGLIDQVIEEKLRALMRRGGGAPEPIVTKDLLAAAKQIKPSTREWFASAKNHALYANQGGLYDDVLSYLKIR